MGVRIKDLLPALTGDTAARLRLAGAVQESSQRSSDIARSFGAKLSPISGVLNNLAEGASSKAGAEAAEAARNELPKIAAAYMPAWQSIAGAAAVAFLVWWVWRKSR